MAQQKNLLTASPNAIETVEKVFLKIIGFSAMISSYLFQE